MTASPKFQLINGGFLHLAPRGEVDHLSEFKTLVFNETTIDYLMARARRQISKVGLLVDFDHLSGEAAGWVAEVEQRPEGMFGRVIWTDLGQRAIECGRYRYISPTFGDCLELEPTRIQPLHLLSVSLTNVPAVMRLPISRPVEGPAA